MTVVVSGGGELPADLSLSGFRLKGGSLGLNFTTAPGLRMYDASAGVLGGADPSVARVTVPQGLGGGYLNVTRSLDSLDAVPPAGTLNYSLSFDLYRSFSFLLPNSTSTLVSRATQVAASEPELASGGRALSFVLRHDVPLWPGVYQVRAFFDGQGGVSLSTTGVIVTGDGGWVWLGACRTYPVYSNDFGVSVPLGSDPSSWPRSVWLTYSELGVQGVATAPLRVNLSAVTFVGMPWKVVLSGYRIGVDSTSGVQSYGIGNGTVFAALDARSAQLGYTLGLEKRSCFEGTTEVAPFTSYTVALNVSRLAVEYVAGGGGYAGGAVTVSDSAGAEANGTTDSGGVATFYLPTGTYNVTARGGGGSAEASVQATAGQSEQLVLGGNEAGAPSAVLAALLSAGAVGVAANVGLWIRRRGRAGRQGE